MHARRTPVPVALPPHGVYVWETRHDHGFRMAPEHHPFAELFYVLDGSGTFVVNDTRHPCGPGDVVVVPPRAVHVIEDGPHPLTLSGIGVGAALLAHDPDIFARVPAGRFPASQAAPRSRDRECGRGEAWGADRAGRGRDIRASESCKRERKRTKCDRGKGGAPIVKPL